MSSGAISTICTLRGARAHPSKTGLIAPTPSMTWITPGSSWNSNATAVCTPTVHTSSQSLAFPKIQNYRTSPMRLPRPSPSRLWQLREDLGWTREELAFKAGGTIKTIGRLERGERVSSIKLGTLLRIAQAARSSAVDVVPALGVRPQFRAPGK